MLIYRHLQNFIVFSFMQRFILALLILFMNLSCRVAFSQLVTCSTDKTLALWDVEVCERMRKFKGHQTFVNACDVARRGPQLLCSGSDDGTVKVRWGFIKQFVKFLLIRNYGNVRQSNS